MLPIIGEYAEGAGARDGLDAVLHAQFGEDMVSVAFDGIERENQRLGDLWIRVTLRDQVQDFHFAIAQRIKQRRLRYTFSGLARCLMRLVRRVFRREGGKQRIEVWRRSFFPFLLA